MTLGEKIWKKNQKKALSLYYDLLALKEPPMRILFLITRQFHILMQVKDLRRLGFDNKSIASKAGIPEFAVRRNLVQAKSFSMKELRAALEDGVRAEEDTKTGRMTDQLAVETFLIRYSGTMA